METIHYGTDDYPMNVERLWYEFDHKEVLTDSRDHIGLFAIECNDIDSDDCLVSTQSCGDWREPTSEEYKNPFHFIKGDLSNQNDLEDLFATFRPTTINPISR